MCGIRPRLGIFDLLLIQILFVLEEGLSSICQLDSLILLHLLHSADGFDMSSALSLVFLLQAHVDISELLLAVNVELLYSSLMLLFLLLFGKAVGDFSLFISFLSPESV